MPCYDNRDAEEISDLKERVKFLKNRNDELAALLCVQCQTLEIANRADLVHPTVAPWWARHKVEDAKRRRNPA